MKIISREFFPKALLEIPDPPTSLYIEGELPDPDIYTYICVVGSRNYTSYGKEACQEIIRGLIGYPIVVVSGLAIGMDSIAHDAALGAGLRTIAFPGSGLGNIYPARNKKLSERILEAGGALISEFEPDVYGAPWCFPQRNRLMAGISKAVLIIEAELPSGTLITSRLATEYNRDVFTIPGSIFSSRSQGPHMLLRLGATPITSSEDLLDALGFTVCKEKNKDSSINHYSDCSEDELQVLEALNEPLNKDQLLLQTGLSAHHLNIHLTTLELKGYIKNVSGILQLVE